MRLMSDEVFYAGLEGKVTLKKQDPGLIRQHISFIPFEETKKEDSSLGFSKDMSPMEVMRKVWNIQLNQEAPDEKLAVAEKVGNALGVSPQVLINDDELYKNCRLMYERQRNSAYLKNEKFSPQKVTELYPELSADDTVALTAATRDYVNVLKSRRLADAGIPIYQMEDSKMADFMSVPGYLWNQISSFAKTAYKSGEAQDNISEINYKNLMGELTDEEADEQIAELTPAIKELDKQTENSYISKVAGEGIVTGLTMAKMTWRGGEDVIKHLGPLAMELWKASENVIKPAAIYAAAGGLAALGIVGAPAAATIGVVAGAASLIGLMGASVYAGTYRVEAGSAYREYRMKKDAVGKPLYTQEECQNHAKRVGVINAGIEAGALQCALFGVGKVFGKDAVMAIVKNESAREALIGAGRAAIAKKSLYQGGKQFAETAVPEILEEGAQSAVGNLDENIFGKKTHTTSEVWNDAVNAMIEAVPGVIALSIGGAGIRGIGSYHAMRSVSKMELNEHKEEFKRNAEADMSRGLFEVREESVYDKTAPGTFGKVVQNQMDKNGKGTMYIDAAELSETEEGREALRDLIQKGVAKETEVMASIQNNSPLEIQSGVYFQKANASTGDIVSYYTTFEKDGATMASIKRHKEALKEAARIQNETVKQREEEAAQRIISEDFADKTDIEKDAMRSVLAKGMEDVGKSWREAKEEAINAWMDILGNHEHVETIRRKQKEGESEVSVIDSVEEDGQNETKRVSDNEGWYRDAFKKEGKMPSQRSIMDYDHDRTVKEMEAGGATKEDIDALNRYKEKVEALEGLEDYVKTLDNKHLTAKILLNKDTFDKVYTPFVEELEKGNDQVKKAAKGSALILSKMAETLSRAYGVAVEDIAASLRVNDEKVNGYGQAMYRSKENTLSGFVEKVMKEPEVIGKAYYRVGSGNNTIDISYSAVQHVQNGNHPLTKEKWRDFEESIGNIEKAEISNKKRNINGIPVLIKIKTPNNTFGAVLDFMENGRVILVTVFTNTDKGIDTWMYKNKSSQALTAKIPRLPGQLLGDSQTLQNRSSDNAGNLSISTIQKELGIVKKEEYNQKAYHGSPYVFDRFDLGAIGTGEGGQAHGWGLYFAKDRKVAANYRILKNHDMNYKGQPIGKLRDDLERKKDWDKLTIVDDFINEQDISRMDMSNYEEDAVDWFKKEIYPNIERQSSLLEVDIPDNEYLLNKDVPLSKQSQKVKEGIVEYYKSRPDDYIAVSADELGDETGESFYEEVVFQMKREGSNTPEKDASLLLNKLGIKGLAYHGGRDGQCFVVFDDKAIKTINRYNQTVNQGTIAEVNLTRDEAAWSKNIDAVENGDVIKGSIHVMNTPLVMQMLGIGNLPIQIDVSKLNKIKNEHPEMTASVLKQIPRALTNPIMISRSKTVPGRIVVALDIKGENGVNVVVPFILNTDKKGIKANIIASAYSRKKASDFYAIDHQWFINNMNGGSLLYADRSRLPTLLGLNKKNTTALLKRAAVQFRLRNKSNNGISVNRILNETDLVKLKNENPEYYQKKEEYAGAYEAENNAIHIFSAGNESTAIHEGAHFFLSTLERLSQDTTISEEARGKIEEDLSVIRNWASYRPEVMKEYRGTALSKEFREYEKAIKENPDDESAKERFMQERFARGFERYLLTGKAPSKELQGAFRRFKSWLTNLYRSAMNLGKADAPEEMKQIFDKMVATEEEIEAWGEEVKARSLAEDINKLNKAVDTEKSEAGNIKEWLENIKETAKEKALAHFMKQYKGELLTQFDTAAEEKGGLRDQARERIRNEASDIYNIDIMRESGTVDKNILLSMIQSIGIETEEAFDKKIEELGGHLEERAEKEVQKERQKLIDEMLTEENIRSEAESLLLSPLGKSKLASIENKEITGLIKKYIRQYNAALLSLENKELTEAQIKEKVYKIKEKYGLLTEEEIADKTLKEEKRTDKEAIKDLKAEAETLKDRLKKMTAGLKEAAESFQTPMTALRKEAKAFLDEQTVSKATNSAWWERKAQTEEIKASQALFKRDFATAGLHKKRQMEYEAIAYQAKRNEEAVYTAIHGNPKTISSPLDKEGLEKRGILGVVNRIGRKENPVRLSEQSRYFVEHMAYQLGLTKKDGRLPTKDGESVSFSWEWLAREINPEKAQTFDENGVPYTGDDVIAPWAKALFEGNRGSYTRLPMQAFREVMDAMKAVYRIGRREYEGNSFMDESGKALSFDEAAEIIVKEVASDGLSPYERKVTATTADKVAGVIDKSVMELALPEVLIGRMGKRVYELIYKPVDRAYKRKREMTEKALRTLKQIFGEGSFYTRKEWYSIRNEKKYIFGTTENGKAIQKTKENVLAMALNFGNQENRNRMCETYSCDESQIEQFLSENMEEKDWDFVEAVWKHIDSYWKERNAVQVRLYGVPLGKEKGITFTIKTKEGKTRKVEGMYYPICYDPEASSKTQERSIDEILRADMSGGGFAIGMGSTKARKKGSGGQKLREDLDVYVKHIEESINHITLREATVDVYKLLSRRDVADVIERKMGIAYCRELKQWAQDSWHNPIEKATSFDRFMNRMKRNYTSSVMMYRLSTALLNGANLSLYLHKMGAARTISSISRYWLTTPGKRKEIREFILKNSSMMRNRETNLDADLARGINVPSAKGRMKGADQVARAAEPINRRGYQFIAYTDSILSCPMWYETYWGEMLKQEASGVNPELRHENAVLAADKMVRETFGSGEEKDKPGIMRRGNIKNFIPFYTYTNLVMNQFIRGGYKIFDGDVKGGVKDLVGTTLYWWILQAVMEASIRHALTAASDGEDKYNWWQRFGYAMISGGPIGGIPFLRDAVPAAYAHLSGMYSDDGVPRASGLEIIAETGKLLQAMTSDNKDWTDVGRAAGRVTNRAFGFSDTVSDGFWTMVRASTTDTESMAREIIASVLLDKNLKKKKKETKKGQMKDAQTRYLEMKEKERKRKEKKSKEQK